MNPSRIFHATIEGSFICRMQLWRAGLDDGGFWTCVASWECFLMENFMPLLRYRFGRSVGYMGCRLRRFGALVYVLCVLELELRRLEGCF